MKINVTNKAGRTLIFIAIIFIIAFEQIISYLSRTSSQPSSYEVLRLFEILFPFYWFSLGALIGSLILLFSPAGLENRFLKLFLWWIPITVIIIILFNLEPTGGSFGISFPDPFAPEPLALISGALLSLTLIVKLISHSNKEKPKK